jgi:hypothetical protein
MRVKCFCLGIVLLPVLAARPQQEPQQQEQQPRQGEQQEPQPRKPTLGPSPAPSLYGPRTSNVMDVRRLVRLRKVYVERIDNGLSEIIMEGLAKSGRFRVVASRAEADGVMRGTCMGLRRMKVVHSEVYLSDVSGASVWQDSVRRLYNPPALETAVADTATLILTHLREDALQAERGSR